MYLPKSLSPHFPCKANATQLTHDNDGFYLFGENKLCCYLFHTYYKARQYNNTDSYSWAESMQADLDLGWINRYLASLPLFPAFLTPAHS